MPPGTTIGHVHLHVGSIEDADAFYHRALGFDKTVWSYPGALFLSAGGYHHHLATNIWSPGPRTPADRAQLLDWDLLVPREAGVAAIGTSLRAAGHHTESGPHGFRGIDPWGTHVRILAEG
jgi:catechol 2,3-dioxygenase